MTDQPLPLRVAIVDDHPMFRLGLAAAIKEMDGIELVGEAQRADQVRGARRVGVARRCCCSTSACPMRSGLEVNRWLAEHHPEVRVVMLTMSEDLDNALTALRDGASGYLVKGAGPERVEHAIRTVASGDVVLDHISRPGGHRAWRRFAAGRPRRPFPQLTDREFDILQLLAEGLDNTSIARRLFLSPKTVRNHVSNVFAKIDAPDRPGAIVLAHRHGLGT